MRNAYRIVPVVAALALSVLAASHSTFAQTTQPVLDGKLFQPIIGEWKLNHEKSATGGSGARQDRWVVYSIEGDGLRMSIYDNKYPQPLPTRDYFARLDGREYPNPHAPGIGETVALWQTDQYVIYRLVRTNGVPTQRVTYTVSADKKTLVWQSWNPETPWQLGIQAYDRVDTSPASTTNPQPGYNNRGRIQ